MTDTLEFDVELNLAKAKAQRAELDRALDRPVVIDVKLNSKALSEALKQAKIVLDVEVDEDAIDRELRQALRFLEGDGASRIDADVDFDVEQVETAVRTALRSVEDAGATVIDADVNFRGPQIEAAFRAAAATADLSVGADVRIDPERVAALREATEGLETGLDVDFSSAQILESLDRAIAIVQEGAPSVDVQAVFDEDQVFGSLVTAIEAAQAAQPQLTIEVDIDEVEVVEKLAIAIEAAERFGPKIKVQAEAQGVTGGAGAKVRVDVEFDEVQAIAALSLTLLSVQATDPKVKVGVDFDAALLAKTIEDQLNNPPGRKAPTARVPVDLDDEKLSSTELRAVIKDIEKRFPDLKVTPALTGESLDRVEAIKDRLSAEFGDAIEIEPEVQAVRDATIARIQAQLREAFPDQTVDVDVEGPTNADVASVRAALAAAFPEVTVDVEPRKLTAAETNRLRRELQLLFDAISPQIKPDLKPLTSQDLLKINRLLQDIVIDVKLDELSAAELTKLEKQVEKASKDVKIGVDVDGPGIAELKVLAERIKAGIGDINVDVDTNAGRLGGAVRGVGGAFKEATDGAQKFTKTSTQGFGALIGQVPTAAAQIVGLGNNFSALTKPGGPIAGVIVALGAASLAIAALPGLVFAVGGAVSALTVALGVLGGVFAGELEPVIRGITGIEDLDGKSLNETFQGLLSTLKAILAIGFFDLADRFVSTFGPGLTSGLSQFVTGLLPGLERAFGIISPLIDQLSNDLAGPLGRALGNVVFQFTELVQRIIPKLTDGRLVALFDRLAGIIDRSGPGLEALIDLFFKLSEAILQVTDLFVQLAPIVTPALEPIVDLLQGIVVTVGLAATGLAVFSGVLRRAAGDSTLFDKQWDRVTSGQVKASASLKSSASLTDEQAKALERAGFQAGTAGTEFDKLLNAINGVSKKGIGKAAPDVDAFASSIFSLSKAAERGQITNDQYRDGLIQLLAQLGINETEAQEAVERYKELVDVQAELTKAADEVSLSFQAANTFARQSAEAQTLVRLALLDGTVSAEELARTQTILGLSLEQTTGLFKGAAEEVKFYRDALLSVIPNAQTAADIVDLGSVKLGFKTAALFKELRAQISDTFAFFANIQRIIDAGNIDLARFILGSGLDKQTQEALAAEGARGGTAYATGFNEQVKQFNIDTAKLETQAQTFATQLGVKVTTGLNTGIDQGGSAVERLARKVLGDEGPVTNEVDNAVTQIETKVGNAGLAAAESFAESFATGLAQSLTTIDLDLRPLFVKLQLIATVLGAINNSSAEPSVSLDDSEFFISLGLLTSALGAINNATAAPTVTLNVEPFRATFNALNAALDALDRRVITVDVVANVAPGIQPRELGGPVFPGGTYRVNEAGNEAIVDARGFRFLPPGERTMTFDRAGVIVPAHLLPDRGAPAAVAPTRPNVTKNVNIVANGTGRDPMLFAKRVARYLP